ncbi:MAG: hypothetical protein V3U73_14940 [bacterium]
MKPIGMNEMNLIFSVTDELGLSREAIEVPLMPDGDGSVVRMANGKFEIVIPANIDLEQWLPILKENLVALGAVG